VYGKTFLLHLFRWLLTFWLLQVAVAAADSLALAVVRVVTERAPALLEEGQAQKALYL